MKKITFFSKSYKPLIRIKKNFSEDNNSNLNRVLKINKVYSRQSTRRACQNCSNKTLKPLFKSFGIIYLECSTCWHLNGKYNSTDNFSKNLYQGELNKNYSVNYLKDFNSRVKNIYLPKVAFLKKAIGSNITVLDIGSGGGHFLKALELNNIKGKGFESSNILCELGNKFLKNNKITKVNIDQIYSVINGSNADCISLIGVLEHLSHPQKLIDSFNNSRANYLFISVPTFSFSVFLENVIQDIFPRQLSGGHTHLYTEKSLNYLAKKNKLKIVAEWWFGADIADLFRSVFVKSKMEKNSAYNKKFNQLVYKHLDQLQSVLDKNKACSEVHMIFKKT
jgi:SAM-dependent methyltransferase